MNKLFDQLMNEVNGFMKKKKSSSSSSSFNKADLLKGASAGGLAGLLLGSKKSRKLMGKYGAKAGLAGGAAVIGTFAYKAYQKWAQENQENAAGESSGIESIPLNTEILIKAMIFAAKADGHIDANEKSLIEEWLQENEIASDADTLISRWLDEPLNPQTIADSVNGLEQASEVYFVSLLVIDADHFLEKAYLDALAKALKLPPSLVERIESQASVNLLE